MFNLVCLILTIIYLIHLFISKPSSSVKIQISDFQKMRNLKHKVCSVCGSKRNVQVHHILPVQNGGSNNYDNLKCLCEECHELEHGYTFNYNNADIVKRKSSSKTEIINEAIKNNELLWIKYMSPKYQDNPKSITTRIIKPIELYKKTYKTSNGVEGYRVTLKAFCTLRNEERNFQIRRITKINIHEE